MTCNGSARATAENDWSQQLGQVARNAGIRNETVDQLLEGTLNVSKKNNLRKVGQVYTAVVEQEGEAGKKARKAASAMLRYNRGQIATDNQKEAIETGKKLADTLRISEDGKLHVTIGGRKVEGKGAVEVTTSSTVPTLEETRKDTKTQPAPAEGQKTPEAQPEPAEGQKAQRSSLPRRRSRRLLRSSPRRRRIRRPRKRSQPRRRRRKPRKPNPHQKKRPRKAKRKRKWWA